jgi:hypothetical protein
MGPRWGQGPRDGDTQPGPRGCVAPTAAGTPCPRTARDGDLCGAHRAALAVGGRCVAVHDLTGARCPAPVARGRRAYGCLCARHAAVIRCVWAVCDRAPELRERLVQGRWTNVRELKER